jgi:hypothetical protein
MNNKNKKIALFAMIVTVGVLCGSYVFFDTQASKESLVQKVYGDWVAAEGFCNESIKGIKGIDIHEKSTLKNGKRYPFESIQITSSDASPEICKEGVVEYDFEFTIIPDKESYFYGEMNGMELIKSKDENVLYFKMSKAFKSHYDASIAKVE